MEIIYKNLQENEISRELFRHFVRHQTVVKCRRKENGKWIIKDDSFIDDWSEADYKFLVSCLRNTAATGGLVYGNPIRFIERSKWNTWHFVNELQNTIQTYQNDMEVTRNERGTGADPV